MIHRRSIRFRLTMWYAAILSVGLGLFGTLFTARKRKSLTRQRILGTSIFGLLLLVTTFALGCGSSSTSPKAQTSPAQAILMVTGTAGSLSHSTPVTITVN